jgi:hypothetical protein
VALADGLCWERIAVIQSWAALAAARFALDRMAVFQHQKTPLQRSIAHP